jgi:hypothetical protein
VEIGRRRRTIDLAQVAHADVTVVFSDADREVARRVARPTRAIQPCLLVRERDGAECAGEVLVERGIVVPAMETVQIPGLQRPQIDLASWKLEGSGVAHRHDIVAAGRLPAPAP